MELLILLIVAILVRIPFLLQAGNLIDFDEATALTFFLSFFTMNFFLMKRIAGRTVAIFSSLFFIFMPPSILDVSMRVWGDHAELWVFQATALLLLAKYFDGPQKFFSGKLLFTLGLVIGAAFWISEFFLLFLIPFLLYFFLRFRQPQDDSLFRWIWNFFRLAYFRLPGWLKKVLIVWHILLAVFILIHISALFFGNNPAISKKFFKIFSAVLALIFTAEVIAIYFIHAHPFSKLLMIRNLGPLFGGLLTGYFPALFFSLRGGKELRIFQKSDTIGFSEIPARLQLIFTQKIPQFLFGLGDGFYVHADSLLRIGVWIFGGIVIVAIIATIIYFRKDFAALIWPKPSIRPSYVWIYFFILMITVKANIWSTLEAAQYLAPAYIGLVGILAYFLGIVIWKKSKPASILIALIILAHFAYGNYKFYDGIPKAHAQQAAGSSLSQ